MKPWLVLIVAALGSATPLAQTRQSPPTSSAQSSDRIAEAYAQFLIAHHLEDDDDVDGAVAAYRRAMALDPKAAEIVSDLANLYMRTNRAQDAISVAEQALAVDADNREAHQILGTIYASIAMTPPRAGRPQTATRDDLKKGIQHLEAAIKGLPRSDANIRAMLSQLYLADRNYDKAIPMLSDLVRQEPDWQEGVGLLMDAYTAAGRSADAARWLEEAAPENPELYVKLGDIYSENRQWAEAVSSYERVLSLMPRQLDLRIRYASALLNTGKPADVVKAHAALQEALALRANDERALFLLAQAERRAGTLAQAERTARRLITQNARNPRGYIALAEVLEERQSYAAVIESLEPVLPSFRTGQNAGPILAMLLPHLGFAYERTEQFDKAVAAFEEAQKLAPGDPTIAGYLVQAQISAKRYPQAIELARAARRENASDVRLAKLEAQALHDSGQVDQGLAVLESFVQDRGDDPRAHVALAQAYAEAQRGVQALKVLQTAQTKFPAETLITFELGAELDKQKKHAEAEAAFRQVLAREPENAAALNYLGYILAERGERLDESVDLVKRALKLEPENGSYLDSLGWAYFKAGNMDLALDNLQRAADQLTRNSVIQDHFGDVLFKLSRYDDAISAWTRALAGDGDAIDRTDIDRKIRSAKQRLPRR